MMLSKALALVLALAMVSGSAIGQSASKPVKFDFKAVNVAQVIQLIYGEVLTSPYVLDPEVLSDARLVSFRYTSDTGMRVPSRVNGSTSRNSA